MVTPTIIAGIQRRLDRRQAMLKQLANRGIKEFQFAADLGLSVDWRSWECNDIRSLCKRVFPWRLPKSQNPWWNRDLRLGEIACALTHWNIWNYAYAQSLSKFIVLEDDAQLRLGFATFEQTIDCLTSKYPTWDLLYLGRERVEPDRAKIGEFTQPGFSYCTFGYVLTRKGVSSLLKTSLPDSIIPVDEFLPAMYLKHPRNDVNARFPSQLSAYGLKIDLVEAQEESKFGSDTESSPFLKDHCRHFGIEVRR